MSFSEFDACSPTLAVARFKRYKRRILTPKKHAHTTPIAVLKNTPQNVAYLWPIQYIIEKDSNSSDFFHELAALPVKVREGLVKALSEKSPTWFTYCTSMRPSGLRYTWARLLLPAGVTLSRSEGSVVLGIEMLRCGSA